MTSVVVWPHSFITAVVIGSVLSTIVGICLALCMMRRLQRKMARAERFIDAAPMEKDVAPEQPTLYQVQPILTVSEVVHSVKQSFDDMGDAILPRRWARPNE